MEQKYMSAFIIGTKNTSQHFSLDCEFYLWYKNTSQHLTLGCEVIYGEKYISAFIIGL